MFDINMCDNSQQFEFTINVKVVFGTSRFPPENDKHVFWKLFAGKYGIREMPIMYLERVEMWLRQTFLTGQPLRRTEMKKVPPCSVITVRQRHETHLEVGTGVIL